jgi:hypothetical protein
MLSVRRFFLALCLVLVASWGCRKTAVAPVPNVGPEKPAPEAVTPPPPPKPPAPLESAPLSKTITAPSDFELGEKLFQAGNYPRAAKALEDYLNNNPKGKGRDQALFHLGLSRALAGESGRLIEAPLRKLLTEFPKGQYRDQAEFILGLLTQIDRLRVDVKERDDRIKKLSEELQALKDIDLQRRPKRPE